MSVGATALADLHRARRRRRIAQLDPFEALYRAYVAAIVGGIVLWLASGAVGDTKVGAHQAAAVAAHGAPWVGLGAAAAFAIGLRSGGRGGPLVIEAADVRHVLMSPLPRKLVLRGPAARQLRSATFSALVVGAALGLLAWRRLPGNPAAWVASAAAASALAAAGSLGLAMVVSGRRLGARVGSLLSVGVLAWSAADIVTRSVTSPMSALGVLALWPLRWSPIGLAGVALPLAAAAAGLVTVGGCSIEAAERRATLVGQIRFAATLQDIRTVTVLRRQLAQEVPRQRPWVDLGTAVAVGGRRPRAARTGPAWRRSWASILRFPAVRLARLAVLGAVAGVSLLGAWRGTTPLVVVAGLALHVAALDAIEPVAQEVDHPDRAESYAVERGALQLRLAAPPLALVVLVGVFGVAAAAAVAGAVSTSGTGALSAAEVGAVVLVPAALLGLGSALVSTVNGPPPLFSGPDSLMPPEMAGVKGILRALLPPALAVVGVLPVLAGRHPRPGEGTVAAVALTVPEVLVVAVLVGMWVLRKDRISAWWRAAMEEGNRQRGARVAGRSPGAGGV